MSSRGTTRTLWTLAARNLRRNGWRSLLTIGGVAVSVALMVWTLALMDGLTHTMIRGATSVQLGQVQIHRADYAAKAKTDRAFEIKDEWLATLEAIEEVKAASPRLTLWGLLGHERTSRIARLVGVDPSRERRVAPVVEGIQSGGWLDAKAPSDGSHQVVLGSILARQLGVKPGDELVVFLQASDGSLGNDRFVVKGVIKTGNQMVDRTTAYLALAEAQYLGALDDQVHEIAIGTETLTGAADVARRLREALTRSGLTTADAPAAAKEDDEPTSEHKALLVRPWSEVAPDLYGVVELTHKSTSTMYFIVYLIAVLSVINTQRMSAWERRREFGVMLAIGMTPGRLFRLVLVETALLSLAGAGLGVVLGGGVAWWQSLHGFDLSLFTDKGSFSYMGIAFSERIYLEVGASTLLQPALVMGVVGGLAGAWPAWKAMRLDPAPTIAGRS